MKAPLPDNEVTSTEALHPHQILDIEPEAAFDDIRRLAARICETPVALVSLVDECRQWFKMQEGMEFFEPERDVAFCTQTMLPSGALIVPDVLTDERFATNPLVTEYPQIRFFAGVPLIATNGHTLGKLCVIDYVPRELSPEQVDALWALSRQAMMQLELRRHLAETVDIRTKPQGKELICPFVHQSTKLKLRRRQDVDKSWRVKKNLLQKVDEYHNTESELARSLCILRSTLDSTANGILVVNSEGEVLYYNKKFLGMWQFPTSISISRKCNRAKAFFESQVQDPELFNQAFWEISCKLDSESYDLLELKDGRIFAHYSEPQWLGDKIIGRVWSIWDITESKRTEEGLKLNAARFRTLAEKTDASIFLIQEKKICYTNPAAETLTGYTRKELLNNFNIENLIKNKRLRQVHKQDGSAYYQYLEMQILTKNSMVRWLACTVEVLDGALDFAGKSVEMITAIDITDYKQAESELRQALEQAKRLNELRERFVSMLCHEFRTPLNVVAFSADLLRRHIHQWTEEKNRSYLDMIQTATNQISELLDEILLFGRAEAAKFKCESRPLNIKQFCHDIVVQMQLANGNQRLINFVSQGNCTITYLDPKLLQHILTNLLSNAMKYSPRDKTVSLELFCQNQDVIFQVKDVGIGIPVVDKQQIFEPFYRGSNVDNISGIGLGLSIVKTLVELHGGQIDVESEVGLGTTFTVKLPSTIVQ